MNNKLALALLAMSGILASCEQATYVEISKPEMENKVKGAWAGKMIGVMYGRPMEFQCTNGMYTDTIAWTPKNVEAALLEDDIYGQMNFMSTMEQHGQDVSIDTLAKNFAYAKFALCHANLQGRKNYFDGIPAAELALPENSIHCEDIDFQIECDFIGFVNPCMPESSNKMCEKVGAIMASSDGMYAGMYISALESMAYSCNSIDTLVNAALGTIPAESKYAECVRDVIASYKEDPNDWTKAWNKLYEKWQPYDICTPDYPFNIDAKLNGAYVVMGLLYGGGDWFKTMEITIRSGQDTDCNTATAGAVLGIINGYDAIPDTLKSYIPEIADRNFSYTEYSYNKAVEITLHFIDENVEKNGGKVEADKYVIKQQSPVAPIYEPGHSNVQMSYLVQMSDSTKWNLSGNWENFIYGDGDYDLYKVATKPGDSLVTEFDGTGAALLGSWNTDGGRGEVYIDGVKVKDFDTYYVAEAGKFAGNRAYLFFVKDLPSGKHTMKVVNVDANPKSTGNKLYVERMIVYK